MDISQIIEIIHSRSYEEELKFQKQFIDEVKKSLKDKSIPDLTALLAYWRSEVKSHRRFDYPSRAKRWEAERWVEAIEEIIREAPTKLADSSVRRSAVQMPPQKKSKAYDASEMINALIKAFEDTKVGNPTFKELETATGYSAATWQRRLTNAGFVISLKDELQKRIADKRVTSEAKKAALQTALNYVDTYVEKAAEKRINEIRAHGAYDENYNPLSKTDPRAYGSDEDEEDLSN